VLLPLLRLALEAMAQLMSLLLMCRCSALVTLLLLRVERLLVQSLSMLMLRVVLSLPFLFPTPMLRLRIRSECGAGGDNCPGVLGAVARVLRPPMAFSISMLALVRGQRKRRSLHGILSSWCRSGIRASMKMVWRAFSGTSASVHTMLRSGEIWWVRVPSG
jgi:hypothetical protein